MGDPQQEWPRGEVFVRSKSGLGHKHCGSLHAADAKLAIQMARDVYTRRQEGTSVWVVRSDHIVASDPADKGMYFDPARDKVYRHPTFHELPESVDTCRCCERIARTPCAALNDVSSSPVSGLGLALRGGRLRPHACVAALAQAAGLGKGPRLRLHPDTPRRGRDQSIHGF
jgi:ring-1,2-phenylacetyl-CoA epoxidase subunit PaaB